jgi:hypothetical protein
MTLSRVWQKLPLKQLAVQQRVVTGMKFSKVTLKVAGNRSSELLAALKRFRLAPELPADSSRSLSSEFFSQLTYCEEPINPRTLRFDELGAGIFCRDSASGNELGWVGAPQEIRCGSVC